MTYILLSIFQYTIPLMVILCLVIFLHELGHCLVGRLCNVKADVFSLGFGPELWSRVDQQGTKWRIALFPLGGYVRFHGDADGTSAIDYDALRTMPPE